MTKSVYQLGKRISEFWHNALKVILFKNIYEQIDKNAQLLTTVTENNKINSENISKILEKSKEYSIEIMRQNKIQITQQHEKFKEQISEENYNQNQEIKKYLSDQINSQNSEFVEQFSEKSNKQYENFIKQNKEQNIFYIRQNRIEKSEYVKQSYEQNLQYIRQNRKHFTEYVDKTFGQIKQEVNEFIEQISDLGNQNKIEYENLITQNKKQYTELLRENRERHRALIRQLSDILDKQITTFIKQISKQVNQKNNNILEQISENINHQILGFIEKISQEGNRQNSVFIRQNTDLIRQILSQSLQNHGTISKKFGEIVSYQKLSELRENLIIIKTTIIILEKLDSTQLKALYNLYLKYHRTYPNIPILDLTRGFLIVKILFPSFFTEMFRNLSILKNQFDDTAYTEITITLKEYDTFFKNFIRDSNRIAKIKKMLDTDIATVDKMLTKLID